MKQTGSINSWNPNDPCFDWKRPSFGGLTFKNRGHLGSRLFVVGLDSLFSNKYLATWLPKTRQVATFSQSQPMTFMIHGTNGIFTYMNR